MSQVYVHLNDKTVKREVLKAYGIEVEEDNRLSSVHAKPCPRCHTKLPSFAKICPNCFFVLDQATAIKAEFNKDLELDKEQKKPGWVTGTAKNNDDIRSIMLMIREMQKTIDDLKQQVEK